MIHYHGPDGIKTDVLVNAMFGKHFMVSFATPKKIRTIAAISQSFSLDNGAFSFWKSGKKVNWDKYYKWCEKWLFHPACDFAIMPDLIDGNAEDSKALLYDWPFKRTRSAPVWHLHEPISYLKFLVENYSRVAMGSSGDYAKIGTLSWKNRMHEALSSICDEIGRPPCKIHGLRMLNHRIFSKYPFSSADSTNLAQGHKQNKRWTGSYKPPNNTVRAIVMASTIEAHQSAEIYKKQPDQKFPIIPQLARSSK